MYPLHGSAGLAAPILRCLVGLCRAESGSVVLIGELPGPFKERLAISLFFSQFWFF
jgi:hypothetical protein